MEDIHTLNAATIFRKDVNKVTAEERDVAKNAFYVFSYVGANSTTELEKMEAMGILINLHARAIGCLCECLGLNAENFAAVCSNSGTIHDSRIFQEVMQKWNLINEKGEPTL